MDLMLLRVFQCQVEVQCGIALRAANELEQPETVWASVQNLLNAVANISKACWGSGGKLAAEREPLRSSLQLADSSPIRWTTVRNHWEHFDERLDEWWSGSPHHNFIDMNVMPRSAIHIQGMTDLDWFRNLDPQSGELTFWGDTFDLPTIVNEVRRIQPIAAAEANKHNSEPPNSGGIGQ